MICDSYVHLTHCDWLELFQEDGRIRKWCAYVSAHFVA